MKKFAIPTIAIGTIAALIAGNHYTSQKGAIEQTPPDTIVSDYDKEVKKRKWKADIERRVEANTKAINAIPDQIDKTLSRHSIRLQKFIASQNQTKIPTRKEFRLLPE